MLPFLPAHVADASLDPHVLGLIRFGESTSIYDGVLTLALRPCNGIAAEVWRSASDVTRGERDGLSYATNGEAFLGSFVSSVEDVATAARRAYETIIAVTRAEGYPFLLRAWNHVRDINGGSGDDERYRRFCAGRHEALTAAGLHKRDFPSASAVGMTDGQLAIYFVASRSRGTQVENPRQVSAYDYPREYGPRSPSFARATVAQFGDEAVVFVSGTASVVGHETRHVGDLERQAEETILNLHRIVGESGATTDDVRLMKVYVRRGSNSEKVRSSIAAAFPAASLLVVESDICRRDLLLEVEAIAMSAVRRV